MQIHQLVPQYKIVLRLGVWGYGLINPNLFFNFYTFKGGRNNFRKEIITGKTEHERCYDLMCKKHEDEIVSF